MIYLKNGKIPLKYATNDKLVEEKNGRYDLEFEYPLVDGLHKQFKKFDLIIAKTPRYDYQDFYITDIQKLNNKVKILCKHIFFLTAKLYVPKIKLKEVSCSSAFNSLAGLVADKNNFVFNSDVATVHSIDWENKMLFDVLMHPDSSFLNTYGGIYVRDNNVISLKTRRGKDTEFFVAKRKNISDINIRQDADFVVTRLYLKANKRVDEKKKKEGDKEEFFEITLDSPLINEYPYIFSSFREYRDSFRDVKALEKYGKSLFKDFRIDLPKESFSIKGTDEINSYNFDINDTAIIYYEDYDLHKRIEVVSFVYSPMQERYLEVRFGDKLRGLTDTLVKGQVEGLKNVIKNAQKQADTNIKYSIEEFAKENEVKLNEVIEDIKINLKGYINNIKNNLEEEIKNIDLNLETETIKALTNAELKKHLQSAEGKQELIESITADVTWLKAVIVNTELLNTIVANMDLAKVKELIVDTAFIETILSKDEFLQQFEDGGAEVTNIFSKLRDNITQSISTRIKDSSDRVREEFATLLAQKSSEIDLSVNKLKKNLDAFVEKVDEIGTNLKLKTDTIESNVYYSTTDIEPFFSLKDTVVEKDTVFERDIEFESEEFYDFRFRAKGQCTFILKFFVDSKTRKYPYKYAKKYKQYIRVIREFNSETYKNGIAFFKTPANVKDCKLIIKATEDSDIEFFKVAKNGTKSNLQKITQLRQDLNGFKLTVQDNQNDIRSEIVQKSNEITQKIVDERANTTNQIQQINDNLNLKVSKDKLISEINLSPEKIKIKSELLEVSGDLIVEGDLWAYKGEIGGFKLGEEKGHKWLTGATNFNVGMSDGLRGSGRRTALWANWGDDWVSPNDDAWYVRDDGSMYCGVGATFQSGFQSWGAIRVGSALKIDSSDISYNETNKVVWHSQLNNSSDFRLKENINKCEIRALDTINDIDVVQFDWKKEAENKGHEDIGFVAQWLEKQVPKSIRNDGNGFKSIRYSDLVPYLVKAIQELSVKVDKLEDENRKLKEGYNGSNTY